MKRVLEAGQQIAPYGNDLLSRRTSRLYANLTRVNWAWRLNDTLAPMIRWRVWCTALRLALV